MFTNADLQLAGGRITYRRDEASRVIAAYAFAEEPLKLTRGTHPTLTQRIYPYVTFDHAPVEGAQPSVADINAAATEGSGLSRSAQRGLAGVIAHLNHRLSFAPTAHDFATWSPTVLIDPLQSADNMVDELARAIAELARVAGVRHAGASYVMHRAFPKHVPIVDRHTARAYGKQRFACWVPIWDDLIANHEAFTRLEEWFNNMPWRASNPPLYRLRMLDILLRFPEMHLPAADAFDERHPPPRRPSPPESADRAFALEHAMDASRHC